MCAVYWFQPKGRLQMNNSSNASHVDHHIFSEVVSIYLNLFSIVLLGYLVGQFQLLSKAQIRGLRIFVDKCALPAIFFMVSFLW